MPCKDISEIIKVKIDNEDRLIWYALEKSSCGKLLGTESLILDLIKDKPVAEIAGLVASDLIEDNNKPEDFLSFKTFPSNSIIIKKHPQE